MPTTALRRLVGTATMALSAGGLTLGCCAPAAHATSASGNTTATSAAKARGKTTTQLTESQAHQLAIQLIEDHLKPEAVLEGATTTGTHEVTVVTNDGNQQLGSGVTASWTTGTPPAVPCDDEHVCTATTLANGTLYAYDLLGAGINFSYVRSDGIIINIQDTGGEWNSSGPTGWWPIDETTMPTVVQDPRWDQIVNAVPDPKAKKTKTTNPSKLTAVQLAQQTLTSYLSPLANVASTTSTATSVTVTTTGGVQTDGSTTVTWMTQGPGADQYDRQRDCLSKVEDTYWSGAQESSFGTGTLCTIGGHGTRVMDYYYTRADGYVIFVHNVDGLYNGVDGEFAPVPNENISKLLLDPRWDTVVKSLA